MNTANPDPLATAKQYEIMLSVLNPPTALQRTLGGLLKEADYQQIVQAASWTFPGAPTEQDARDALEAAEATLPIARKALEDATRALDGARAALKKSDPRKTASHREARAAVEDAEAVLLLCKDDFARAVFAVEFFRTEIGEAIERDRRRAETAARAERERTFAKIEAAYREFLAKVEPLGRQIYGAQYSPAALLAALAHRAGAR